jgi:uncharacterized protein YcfJ
MNLSQQHCSGSGQTESSRNIFIKAAPRPAQGLPPRRSEMKKFITLSIAALMSTATVGLAAPAAAATPAFMDNHSQLTQTSEYRRGDRYDRGRYDRRYDNRRYNNNRRYYSNNRYDNRRYRQCDNGDGGTVIGAIAGGLAGHEIAGRGDKTVGTILGGAVGAIAGRAIDRSDGRRC